MRSDEDMNDGYTNIDSMKSSAAMLAFGLFILLFLVAIDRPHWFEMRPISGVARALSLAAHANDAPESASARSPD